MVTKFPQLDSTPATTLATPAPKMAGFEFSSLTLVSQGLLSIGLPVPQSPPNVLGYGLLSNLQNLFSPHIIQKSNDAKFGCFDLESFYWGCKVFDPLTQSTPAVGCTVTVTPFDMGTVARRPHEITFSYSGGVTEGVSVAMQLVDFNQSDRKEDFKCLSKVEFSNPVARGPTSTLAELLATAKVVQIDSVQVRKYIL